MRITPRKEEVERVAAILDSGEYDNATQMAKALIKEVAEILAMRDWHAITWSADDGKWGVNYGPYGSEAEATSVAKKLGFGSLGGHVSFNTLHSPGVLIANRDGKKGWPGHCATCGHAPASHSAVGAGRGHCIHCGRNSCPKFKK